MLIPLLQLTCIILSVKHGSYLLLSGRIYKMRAILKCKLSILADADAQIATIDLFLERELFGNIDIRHIEAI